MLQPSVSPWDILAVAAYFLAILALGFYSMCRSNRSTISGYFLAGRFMTWLPVGASLYASNIGSDSFIGLAGSGAASGFGVGSFELYTIVILQILSWIMLPVYIASGAYTLPEYMTKRFGGSRIRIYMAVLSLILYIVTKISVNMYCGALFIRLFFGWNIYWGILLILGMTAICTVTGGLAAVMYTETLQCLLMVFGATFLAVYSFVQVGGFIGLIEKYWTALPNGTSYLLSSNNSNTCGALPSSDSFRLLHGASDTYLPWPGFLFGVGIMGIWYWAGDQMMVQRTLAAKSISHAQGATIFTSYIKLLPFFTMVLPGMISRVLYPDEVACSSKSVCKSVCDNEAGCSNIAFPKLVLTLLPTGFKGVMFAVMLAALMSDLSGVFNSSATLFSIDIYQRIRARASTREILIVGRIFVIVAIVLSILWIPIVTQHQGGQMFMYMQAISSYFSPPVAVVYLLAVLWPRCNETGAFYGLVCGLVTGLVRMILDFVYPEPACGDALAEADTWPAVLKMITFSYMYFSLALALFTASIAIGVSLLTKAPDPIMLIRTTYWTRNEKNIPAPNNNLGGPPTSDGIVSNRKSCMKERSVPQSSQNSSSEGVALKTLRSSYNWFCGYEDGDIRNGRCESTEDEVVHFRRITSLEQTRFEKLILIFNTVLVLSLMCVCFAVFTFYTPVLAERYKPDWLKAQQ